MMIMRWFFPLALGIGVLATKEAIHWWVDPALARERNGAWLLVVIGWIPLLLWITNNFWPQN